MISSHHAGGRLGNICFQVAACQAHAWRNFTEAVFPEGEMTKYFPKLKKVPDSYRVTSFYHEQGAAYQNIPFEDGQCLVGYFQSPKYYDEFTEEIRDLFDFPYEPVNRTSLHIRRGDYLEFFQKHPGVPKEYIDKAMWFMAEKGFDHFEVFSDDIQWCMDNISNSVYPDYKIEYNTTEDPYQALSEMSSCLNQITCSSTFSLWAAELNRNEDKIVITPAAENYYGPTHRDQDVKDLLRPEWIKIAWEV